MKAFPKLREKLFPRSVVGISSVFGKEVKTSESASPPASENSFPAKKEDDPEPEPPLALTPELEEALFPKTPLMISATFERTKAGQPSPEAPKVSRSSKSEVKQNDDEQDFPII